MWLNVDPLAEKYPNINPYTYVANNPIMFIDPTGMEIVNGETAKRDKLQNVKNSYQEKINDKYDGNLNLSRKDFNTKDEFKEYKADRNRFNEISNALDKSITIVEKIQTAINDFKETDPINFDKVNNLTFEDGNGDVHNIDVIVNAGKASEFGGAVTRAGFTKNADGSYKSIVSINTTMDFNIVTPKSNVLPHEMGHAFNIAKNPSQSMLDKRTINCQDPSNRNSFQSKTAIDWQMRYDNLKSKR